MSKLEISLRYYSLKAGGAHLTLEARCATTSALGSSMNQSVYQIQDVRQLKAKHIADFIATLKLAGLRPRTIQNKMSHIRETLCAAGKHEFADSEVISNKVLGISGGSRVGTKRASKEEEREAMRAKAIKLGRPGLAALLVLTYVFGLRCKEAICASDEILLKWKEELGQRSSIEVFKGTKGGRRRHTPPVNYELAIQALNTAIAIAKSQGGYLIPAKSLKQTIASYRNFMFTQHFIGHSNRYAYACERMASYLREGHSEKSALSKTSLDLGHGDGRGRWIKSVYCRHFNLDPNSTLGSASTDQSDSA